ncbi:hypothetical protein Q4I30_001113 [Leishmania utingensis]|uniref:Uncharacterized protein n=1 Tax=Leishmania utingensis TaxID=653362 RepID=A0AAW3AYH2_9TRYP
MLASRYMHAAAYHASANEADEDELYVSTISADRCSSDDEGAPDLKVEGSPIQQDGSPDVGEVRRLADVSYFSDYAEREAGRDDQAALPSPSLSGDGVDEEDNVCSRKLLPHLCRNGNGPQAMADVMVEGDAEGSCDVEYDSTMTRDRDESFPTPVLELGVVLHSTRMIGCDSPLKSEGGRRKSRLDPLRSLPTPFSKESAAVHLKQPQLSQDVSCWHQKLSHSPPRTSERRFERQPNALPYRGRPSLATVRGSAVVPPSPPAPELNATASCRADQVPRGRRRMTYASSSQASTLASIDAVHVLPLTDMLKSSNPKRCGGGKGTPTATPTTPPRVAARSCDARVSLSPEDDRAAANSPPPRPLAMPAKTSMSPPTRENGTLIRVMHPTLNTTGLMCPLTRVVRDRPPRGAPLILQCTGHMPTPTRTILVDDIMMEGDEGEEEGTVTAGLYTSAYTEICDRSDLLLSSSVSADGVLLRKGGGEGGSGSRDTSNRSPTPDPDLHHGRTWQATRSGSPLVSLTDAQFIGGNAATVAYQQHPELRHHGLDPSPSLTPAKTWREKEVNAVPDLIDFSVETEAMEASWQDESLVLCGYSVEPIRVGCDTSGSPEVRPHHKVPRCHSFPTFSANGATAPGADFPKESRVLFSASQAVEQLQAGADGVEERWARLPVAAPWLPHPRRLERDAVQTVARGWLPRTYTHPPSREAYPDARFTEDLPQTAFPDPHDVRHLVESVEEMPGPGRAFHPPAWTSNVPSEGAGALGGWASGLSFGKSCHFSDSGEFAQPTPSSLNSATRCEDRSPLTVQRERRRVLHTLLARQTRSSESRRCATVSQRYAGAQESMRSARLIAPAADYVATQEQLREQRLAVEAERARLGLVMDMCEAVRPHARDLLLMFLLLVEESNIRCRHRRRGQVQRRSKPTSTHDTAYSLPLNSTVWEESRVTYGMCAEAVNCVLERHGVTRIRATRELCRRVVAWSQYHRHCHNLPTQRESLLGSLHGTADDTSVEYATFVSSVMEFAEQYPA